MASDSTRWGFEPPDQVPHIGGGRLISYGPGQVAEAGLERRPGSVLQSILALVELARRGEES